MIPSMSYQDAVRFMYGKFLTLPLGQERRALANVLHLAACELYDSTGSIDRIADSLTENNEL